MENLLDEFTDPDKDFDSIDIRKQNPETLIRVLKSMILIRESEKKLALERKNGIIYGPVHLGVGQEAIAAGISENLRKTDRVFGAHRSHSHILALNPDFYKLFAEVLGKVSGFSKGMGGSMHLHDKENGFYGSTPIVAGTVSLAVGAGLAAKMSKSDDISVSYLGDGAVEEGVVHESLNLAKLYNLPVLFVVENNLFASHMHISQRQPSNSTARFAKANNIDYEVIDGNNVVKIMDLSQSIIKKIRNGKGPFLIELITYRWYGHVDWRDDIDVGVERSIDHVRSWKKKDPILRLSSAIIREGIWSKREEDIYIKDLKVKIDVSWKKALKDPYPSKDAILNFVYSKNP